MNRLSKLFILLLVLIFCSKIVFAEDIIERYPSENWLRIIKDNGCIYEYTDEELFVEEWSTYGRLLLVYEYDEVNEIWFYKTWDWDAYSETDQVLVTVYEGDYVLEGDCSPALSAVQTQHRRESCLYDHKNVWNVDTQENEWVEREKTIYNTGGEIVLEKYFRNELGYLIKNIDTATDTYYTYEYYDIDSLKDVIHYKKEYAYDNDTQEANILAGGSGTLVASYEYIDTNYMVKWGVDGTITTMLLDSSGKSYNNTYLNPSDNILHIYNWDDSWNLTQVRKEYPDGTIELCVPDDPEDNVWPLVEKRIPAEKTFIKGVNLPWVNYGYDLGVNTKTGTYDGFSKNIKKLYEKMDKVKGNCVRVFLFADLRAGVEFDEDGTPIGFTERVYEDMNALLDCAKALGIKLMPVLFDYMIADGVGGNDVGEHSELIKDPAKRSALVELFRNFIKEFGDHESIYAWDVMNEPECSAGVSGINISDLQSFVEAFTGMIHTETSEAKVTMGSLNKENMQEYWTNIGLDIYQFHYYDHMGSAEDYLTALQGLGKPVIVGEIGSTNVSDKLSLIRENGYSGGLFWQDDNVTDERTISDEEYQIINDNAYGYGTVYTYYGSGCLKTKTLSVADEFGNVLYHFIDEAFHTNDTPDNPSDDYGRVDKQVSAEYDGDGAKAYRYEYFEGTDSISTKYCYKDADVSDVADPILDNLQVTYGYYEDERLHLKTIEEPQNGDVKYKYYDEAFYNVGEIGEYGRLYIIYKEDGTTLIYVEYWAGTDIPKVVKGKSSSGIVLVTYEYDQDNNLIKETRADNTYKTFSDYYGEGLPKYVKEYNAQAELQITYEYNEEGQLVKETDEVAGGYKLFKEYYDGTGQAKYVEEWNA
ncbi:MAG: hypothetical protein KJ864_05185, partial [Candidatus Omnitrophica bacterium]|nr:hypothetical protein [Candidatus Omnitrophota bacterium]